MPENATHAGRRKRRRKAPQGAWVAVRSGVGGTAYWKRNGPRCVVARGLRAARGALRGVTMGTAEAGALGTNTWEI